MALSRGNATPCSVSGSYGYTWSAHQPTGFRRKTGDQTFNACGRRRNTHYTKKNTTKTDTKLQWELLREQQRWTNISGSLQLLFAQLPAVRNLLKINVLLPGMSSWCLSFFLFFNCCFFPLSSDAISCNPPAFILWLLHICLLSDR